MWPIKQTLYTYFDHYGGKKTHSENTIKTHFDYYSHCNMSTSFQVFVQVKYDKVIREREYFHNIKY